ncbi:Transmembrane and coiled-coil domain-containing protein [Branchiostoma belcheri]|nr:Transmembrane and coiled-coil domain-containing protein [Branchiostoma belcheri]
MAPKNLGKNGAPRQKSPEKKVSRPGTAGELGLPDISRPMCYMLVCVVAVGCYLNSLPGDFVHDDVMAIKTNKDVLGKTPLSEVFLNDFWGKRMSDNTSHKSYRPLCVLTFRRPAASIRHTTASIKTQSVSVRSSTVSDMFHHVPDALERGRLDDNLRT